MGTSLTGLTPATTYDALIKVGDNGPIDGTLKTLSDGLGNDLPMQASSTVVNFTNGLQQSGVAVPTAVQVAAKQDTLVSGTNIKTINSTSLLGSGNIVLSASPSGVAGAIQFSNGSAFASDATNLFYDDTNNRLGVGTNAPTATTEIVGPNVSSSSSALRVLNSVGQGILSVTNDGYTQIGDFSGQGYGSLLAFLRPSGATRVTTFNQGNSNLTITNTNGNVIYQNTPITIIGSGSTSATTSLLVQNSAGTTTFSVDDSGSGRFNNGVTILNGGLNASAGLITTTGNLVGSGTSCQIGQLQILSSGNASSTGLGISTPEATMVFQGYTLGSTTIGSQFTFRNYNNTTSNLNNISCGLLRITSIGFQSGNANNLSGNTLWIEPTYNFSNALITGTTVRGIYYNPTLTSLVNTTHYGIQTTSGGAYINTATPAASAALQADSTTQGFLPPRMTDAQRAAIASPAEGLMIFNTDNKGVAYRDGTNWGYLSGALQNATGSGGTLAISFAAGNIVNLTLTASTTLTFAGHVVGTYIIEVTQGGTGSYTLTYPASVKWSGGTAPTLTATVGKTDILTFYHDGTSFFGTYSLNY